jgi:hypothetical protein
MHRWTSLTFAVLVVGAMTVVALDRSRHARTASAPGSNASTAPSASATVSTPTTAPSGSADRNADSAAHGPFDTLPDGRPVPPLPSAAPKSAGFGVILFSYQGAQGAPKDAPARTEALKRAQSVLPEALARFDDAVNKGDRGSTKDAGHVPRGILEPAVEYALFSLQKGAVADTPIDTPRGFWIVRRTD